MMKAHAHILMHGKHILDTQYRELPIKHLYVNPYCNQAEVELKFPSVNIDLKLLPFTSLAPQLDPRP